MDISGNVTLSGIVMTNNSIEICSLHLFDISWAPRHQLLLWDWATAQLPLSCLYVENINVVADKQRQWLDTKPLSSTSLVTESTGLVNQVGCLESTFVLFFVSSEVVKNENRGE